MERLNIQDNDFRAKQTRVIIGIKRILRFLKRINLCYDDVIYDKIFSISPYDKPSKII